MTPATQLVSRYVSTSSDARDSLLSLTSSVRRVETALSGSYSTPAKHDEARELLTEIVRLAWVLRRSL